MTKIKQFQPKIVTFTAVKYRCILHGRVCVMTDKELAQPEPKSCPRNQNGKKVKQQVDDTKRTNEPRSEKTGLRGF